MHLSTCYFNKIIDIEALDSLIRLKFFNYFIGLNFFVFTHICYIQMNPNKSTFLKQRAAVFVTELSLFCILLTVYFFHQQW